jgi:alpha-glucosidase
MVRYVRADELHNAFNFDYLRTPWLAPQLRAVIDETLRDHAAVGAPATWVLSNHDTARHLSRYARAQRADRAVHYLADLDGEPDLAMGLRRSRAATLLMLALPGGAYIYQGEELGLPEVEDLPEASLQDPTWERTNHTDRGRDGCRVPIPWSGSAPPFGFSPAGSAAPWLPQPMSFAERTVERLAADPSSILELYRAALHVRRAHPALAGDGVVRWIDLPDGALGFERDPGFACIVNISAGNVDVPVGWDVLLASGPLDGTALPPDTTVWLQH